MEAVVKRTFWSGKRVLLTGHTGFKGAWLLLWLRQLGAEVIGLSRDPPSRPYLFEEARLDELVTSIQGDIADAQITSSVVSEHRPQIVLHLAAQPIVRESYREPLETLRTNVMGTAVLLDSLRNSPGVEGVLIVTSDKCYEGKPPATGHRETDRLGGLDPYSMSKAAAELVTTSWRKSFEHELPPVASGRAGNVIGGGDWGKDRLVPDALRAVENDEPLVLRSPLAVRPWQHVLDVLDGYLLLVQRLVTNPDTMQRGWNFAPEPIRVTVRSLIEDFYQGLGQGVVHSELQSDQGMTEKALLVIDPTDARELLGWQARLSVDEAVRWTAEWYRGWLENPATARALMEEQIEAYEKLS